MIDLGVQIEPQFGFTYPEIRDVAREAERAGFRAIWISDHLFLKRDAVATSCLEAWTVLAALAVDTTSLRLGPMVSCQSYRNPALLAKIAASVDRLSSGRLDLGVGAGWKEVEYRAYGYEFPGAGQRVDELTDTVAICRALWTEERATYAGRRYSVTDAPCAPKPVQSPLPLWIGGRMPRVMRLAARSAEWFNFLPSDGFPTPEQTRDGLARLDEECRAVGREPASIGKSVFLYAIVGDGAAAVLDLVAATAAKQKLTSAEFRAARPGAMIGTPDQVASLLAEHAAAGARHANVMFPYGHERAMVRLLGSVTAALR